MNSLYFLMIVFSFSSLFSMEKPSRGQAAKGAVGATSNLAAASADFAAASTALAEQAKKEANEAEGIMDGIIEDGKEILGKIAGFFASTPTSKTEQKKSEEIPAHNADLKRLNQLHVQLKKDPTNMHLRAEILGVETSLLQVAAQNPAIIDNPILFNRVVEQLEVLTKQVDKIAPSFAQYPSTNLTMPRLTGLLATAHPHPKFSSKQITDAQYNIRDVRRLKAHNFNFYAKLSAVATLGFGGLAVWKGSKEAAGVAVVTASAGIFCAVKGYKLATLPDVSQDEAIRFLEQQK